MDTSYDATDDIDIVLDAVRRDGYMLEHASLALRGNKEVVLAAVKEAGAALQYASYELRNDKDVVKAAVKRYPGALKYASPRRAPPPPPPPPQPTEEIKETKETKDSEETIDTITESYAKMILNANKHLHDAFEDKTFDGQELKLGRAYTTVTKWQLDHRHKLDQLTNHQAACVAHMCDQIAKFQVDLKLDGKMLKEPMSEFPWPTIENVDDVPAPAPVFENVD